MFAMQWTNKFVLLLLAVALCQIAHPLTAQVPTATMSGTITDSATGVSLPMASIVIVGTAYGATTNTDGTYKISYVPAGVISLRITRVGYKAVVLQDFRVTSAAPHIADVRMSQMALTLTEVVTTGLTAPTSGRKVGIFCVSAPCEHAEPITGLSPLEMLARNIARMNVKVPLLESPTIMIFLPRIPSRPPMNRLRRITSWYHS